MEPAVSAGNTMSKTINLDPSLLAEGEEITVKTLTSGATSVKFLATADAAGGSGLPSNAGKSKYMVLQLSDNVGGSDDPSKWTIDYVRWI